MCVNGVIESIGNSTKYTKEHQWPALKVWYPQDNGNYPEGITSCQTRSSTQCLYYHISSRQVGIIHIINLVIFETPHIILVLVLQISRILHSSLIIRLSLSRKKNQCTLYFETFRVDSTEKEMSDFLNHQVHMLLVISKSRFANFGVFGPCRYDIKLPLVSIISQS